MKFYRDGLNIEAVGPPRTVYLNGHACEVVKTTEGETWFVTLEGTHFCAHGNSFHDAVLAAKEKQNPGAGKDEALERIQKSGKINLTDFCLATGACRAGATGWARQNAVSVKAELSVKEALKMLDKSESKSWGDVLREELGATEWGG